MSYISTFDNLPNELYLCIFDYLNKIDLIYSFLNLNRRLNILLTHSYHFTSKYIDLTKLNPNVFQFYCLQKQINNEIYSIKLNDHQLKHLLFSSNNQLKQLYLSLENDFYIDLKSQFVFEYLQILFIENYSLTWQKPFIVCHYLKHIKIRVKNHWDLVELLNSLPMVEKVDVTIDSDVTR